MIDLLFMSAGGEILPSNPAHIVCSEDGMIQVGAGQMGRVFRPISPS
ncbi:MAG: hypothetical protein U1F70_05350 [Candidatus Competibacteraceae bacterium]